MKTTKEALLRICDANANRAREGLRVCEDISRFYLEDRVLTRALKQARHAITQCILKPPLSLMAMTAARESRYDCAKHSVVDDTHSVNDCAELFATNIQRVEEALRVLEEVGRCFHTDIRDHFRAVRFTVYTIEKKALKKCSSRSRATR